MKKIIVVLLLGGILLFSVSACSKDNDNLLKSKSKNGTLVCTRKTIDEDNYATNETMSVTYKNNIVKKVENKFDIEMDPEYIDFTIGFAQLFFTSFNEIEGIEATIEKKENSILQLFKVDYDNLDLKALEELMKDLSEDGNSDDSYISKIKNKNLTLDEFKSDNLNDYECK